MKLIHDVRLILTIADRDVLHLLFAQTCLSHELN